MIDIKSLTRKPNWRSELFSFLDSLERRNFDWDTQHDCALGLAAGAVEAMTGVDLASEWRGIYNSRKQAIKLLKDRDIKDIADLVCPKKDRVHPSRSVVGDIACIKTTKFFKTSFGVVNGERIVVLNETGPATIDLLEAKEIIKI